MDGHSLTAPLAVIGVGLVSTALLWPWLTEGHARVRRWRILPGVLGLVVMAAAGWMMWLQKAVPASAALNVESCLQMLDAANPAAVDEPRDGPFNREDLVVVSGQRRGTYFRVGEELVRIGRDHGVRIRNRSTRGSLENLQLLASRENATLGMAQSDLLMWLSSSAIPQERDIARRLRAVLPLHLEVVHVLARSDLKQLGDLAGKTVLTAFDSQGSAYTARNLLRTDGVPATWSDAESEATSVCRVLAGTADAVVIVAGAPAATLSRMAVLQRTHSGARALQGVHLMPLSPGVDPGPYGAVRLTPQDYPWLQAEVPTLSVRALLMAFDFSAEANAYQRRRCAHLRRLGRALRADLDSLQRASIAGKQEGFELSGTVPGWPSDRCVGLQ